MTSFFRSAALLLAIAPAMAGVAAAQTGADRTGTRVATVSTGTVVAADNPVRDSAIVELQGFLTRYPNSPLRANALFELGELLVMRADEQFAQAQRAGGLSLTGKRDVVRAFPTWLLLSHFAHVERATSPRAATVG